MDLSNISPNIFLIKLICGTNTWACHSCCTCTHQYLLFKQLAFLWGQRVGFGNERNDVDFVMKSLHELDVQGLQTEEQTEIRQDADY